MCQEADFAQQLIAAANEAGGMDNISVIEGTELRFTEDATREIAELANRMNAEMKDIGARRLHTMLEQLLKEISFSVCDAPTERIEIDADMVRERLNGLVEDRDIRRYLL